MDFLIEKEITLKKTAWIMLEWCNYNRFSTTRSVLAGSLAHGGKSFFIIQFWWKLYAFFLYIYVTSPSLRCIHVDSDLTTGGCQVSVRLVASRRSSCIRRWITCPLLSSFPLVFAASHHCLFAWSLILVYMVCVTSHQQLSWKMNDFRPFCHCKLSSVWKASL